VTAGSNGGETAAVGWDYASGWGSLDIGALATFIANTPGF
jgi:pseudomonalisin